MEIHLTPGQSLLILWEMQGDPRTGPAWGKTIVPIFSEMGFKPNTIFPCVYLAQNYHGDKVIICRQVNNFKVSAKDEATVQTVMANIKNRIHFKYNPKALTCFNGIDYEQTQDYIKVHATTFLGWTLKDHCS